MSLSTRCGYGSAHLTAPARTLRRLVSIHAMWLRLRSFYEIFVERGRAQDESLSTRCGYGSAHYVFEFRPYWMVSIHAMWLRLRSYVLVAEAKRTFRSLSTRCGYGSAHRPMHWFSRPRRLYPRDVVTAPLISFLYLSRLRPVSIHAMWLRLRSSTSRSPPTPSCLYPRDVVTAPLIWQKCAQVLWRLSLSTRCGYGSAHAFEVALRANYKSLSTRCGYGSAHTPLCNICQTITNIGSNPS